MKFSVDDIRWVDYISGPNPDYYKGFELKENIKTKPNTAKLTFTNGEKEFSVIEISLEEAFIKAFDVIDSYEE